MMPTSSSGESYKDVYKRQSLIKERLCGSGLVCHTCCFIYGWFIILQKPFVQILSLIHILTYLQKYTYIHCYLDNDLAGQKTVETIAGMYGRCVYNESNRCLLYTSLAQFVQSTLF